MAEVSEIPDYKRSARTSVAPWAMLVVGIAFAWGGATIDPRSNCDTSGNCAPWLVPLAYVIGIGTLMTASGWLWANPQSGSRIDPETGELVWWKNRNAQVEGDGGRIHPSRIGRLKIVCESEGADQVHLYDLSGNILFHFDAEVIPWPQVRWAEQLVAAWPHIRLDIQ